MNDRRHQIVQNIVDARERAKLNQSEAARLLGIDRPRLIGMERGDRPIDASMLVMLAQAYRVDVTQLVMDTQDPAGTPVLFRSSVTAEFSPGEQLAIERFQTFCTSYRTLLQSVGEKLRPPYLLQRELSTSSRTRLFAVEGDAAQLRRLWNIDEAAPIGSDLFQQLEERGIVVYRNRIASEQLAGASVMYPQLGPVILVNTSDTPQRQVFTAAHELAHVLYHLGRSGDMYFISRKLDRSADEQLANDFASAFLMPESGIKQYLARNAPRNDQLGHEDVIALQRHFRVSYAAMVFRLKKLGIVKGGTHFEALKSVQPVKKAQHLGYPVEAWELAYRPTLKRPQGLPERFVGLVLQAHETGRLSREAAAQALELDVMGFQSYLSELNQSVQSQQLDAEFADAAASVG